MRTVDLLIWLVLTVVFVGTDVWIAGLVRNIDRIDPKLSPLRCGSRLWLYRHILLGKNAPPAAARLDQPKSVGKATIARSNRGRFWATQVRWSNHQVCGHAIAAGCSVVGASANVFGAIPVLLVPRNAQYPIREKTLKTRPFLRG
jgi:hypothetical protein